MKVALVRKSYMHHGGAERYVSTLLSRLVEEGTEVHVFANKWELDPAFVDRVTFHKVPILPGLSVVEVLSFALFSMVEIKKRRFDLVHSFDKTLFQDIYRAGDGCHREWLRIRKQYATRWKRFTMAINPLHMTLLAIESSLFKPGHFAKIIATSHMGKREIMTHYRVAEEDIAVIHNGVNHEIFHNRNKAERREKIRIQHGIPKDDLVVLFVGSGYERKGLPILVKALGMLRESHPRISVMVLGKGRVEPVLSLARSLGVEDRLRMLGVTPNVTDYYVASDIFALPTLYEPFGNVYLEAMASEVPVIISAYSGAAELIEDGVTGLILQDPVNAEQLAQQIHDLTDLKRAQRIARAGRDRALQFTEERNAEMILQIYHEVMQTKSRGH